MSWLGLAVDTVGNELAWPSSKVLNNQIPTADPLCRSGFLVQHQKCCESVLLTDSCWTDLLELKQWHNACRQTVQGTRTHLFMCVKQMILPLLTRGMCCWAVLLMYDSCKGEDWHSASTAWDKPSTTLYSSSSFPPLSRNGGPTLASPTASWNNCLRKCHPTYGKSLDKDRIKPVTKCTWNHWAKTLSCPYNVVALLHLHCCGQVTFSLQKNAGLKLTDKASKYQAKLSRMPSLNCHELCT